MPYLQLALSDFHFSSPSTVIFDSYVRSDPPKRMNTKTPVSALQEYGVSIGKCPKYDLVSRGGGAHNPEFTIRVYFNESQADGVGKSKQEAKHRAAENMLKTLNVRDMSNVSAKPDMPDLDTDQNYVGQLKEYCGLHGYPPPVYDVEEEAGPAHSKVFKLVCIVSQLRETGVSKTKKSAKQMAALKMIERLTVISSREETKPGTCNANESDVQFINTRKLITSVPVSKEEIIKKYVNAKGGMDEVDWTPAHYKDYHKGYNSLRHSSATLVGLLDDDSGLTADTAFNLLKSLVTDLGASLTESQVNGTDKTYTFLGIGELRNCQSIAGFGTNIDLAALNLLKSLLVLCRQ